MPQTPISAHLSPRFVRRLGPHHFAHLRARAEGLDVGECARRYLGVEHGHEAITAHRQAVDAVRAVARRQGDTAWRLVGLTIRAPGGEPRPALEAFVDAHGLDGFSQSEVLALYAEAYPAERKTARGQRLRARQLELLRRLERLAAETPQASDLVAGWFDGALAAKLIIAGILTLGDLNARISTGGVWWRALPGVGLAKARRIERHLAKLLPRAVPPPKPLFALSATPALFSAPGPAGSATGPASVELMRDDGRVSSLDCDRLPALSSPSLLDAKSDPEAVQGWIRARAGSLATVRVYQREAHRLLLWLQYERHGATLAQMTVADCGAFMAFLQNIPARWISRVRAAPGQSGWAPFRGPLSHASCRQAVVIVASLFTWLHAAQYLAANP